MFGHDQLIENNLYIYPDHTSPFDGRHPDGTDSWRDFVATQWSGPNQPSPAAASKIKAHDTIANATTAAPIGLGSYDAPYCALSAEACLYNTTTKTQTMCDGSGYNLRYENNSCVFSGAGNAGAALPAGQTWPAAFWYSACQLSNLSNPATMITRVRASPPPCCFFSARVPTIPLFPSPSYLSWTHSNARICATNLPVDLDGV